MKGKKLIMLTMAILLLLAIPAVVFAAGTKAKAKAKPPTQFSAKFKFHDDGSTLTITGKAKGMDTTIGGYKSLIYGTGSLVKGVDACKGVGGLSSSEMAVGNWTVLPNGKGTFGPVAKTGLGNYVALNRIGTISVRRISNFRLESCGEVK